MSGRSSSNLQRKSPVVPVPGKTLQALFDAVKENHCALKAEIRSLLNRCRLKGELPNLKSLLLEFPPLHSINEMFDEMLDSPIRAPSRCLSGRKSVTPQPSTKGKKRSADTPIVTASKSLNFSPHLFKKEPSSAQAGSPNGVHQLTTEDNEEKDSDDGEDDDVVEIPAL